MKAIAFVFCLLVFQPAFSAEPMRIFVGGPAVEKQLLSMKDAILKAADVNIDVRTIDSKEGAKFLVRGQIEALSSAATLEDTLSAVDPKDFKGESVSDFEAFDLNKTHVNIGVHPDNPVKTLTEEHIRGIVDGSITNWKPITGEDLPIELIHMKSTFGLTREIKKKYLGGKDLKAGTSVTDKDGLMRQMQRSRGTIGLFSGKDTTPTFAPKFFPTGLTYSLILISRKKSAPHVQKVIEILKADAAKRNG